VKVAVVHPFSWPTVRRGGERYANDLASWLASQGHSVDYLTSGQTDGTEYVDGFRMVRLAATRLRFADRRGWTGLNEFGRTIATWLAAHRYDIVHSLWPAGAVAAARTKHPGVFTVIGHPRPLRKEIRRADRIALKRACQSAQVTTALSASAAAETTDMTGVQTRVLHPGLRLDVFTPNLRARSGPARVLFAADADDPRKRLSVLLAAMPMVLRSRPDARLILGGPGVTPEGLDPTVAACIDPVGVGALDDVAARFRSAHVTVLPSIDEAFGLVLVESLACGTPVVASDSGGMPEIVVPSVGRLAVPDDPAALAVAIIETVALAENPAAPTVCAEHARRWDWERVGPDHLAAYDAARRDAPTRTA
jgi:phosphatidylinositol alpha-mannosyltransferase